MAELNYSFDLDLTEVKAMVDNLIPYVYEDELYGRVDLKGARLTPGAILLRLRRLQALREQLNASQSEQLALIMSTFETTRAEWTVAFTRKLVREVEARLRDIQTYLGECNDDPKTCANAYMPEALRRTMIAEIFDVLPSTDEHYARLMTSTKQVDGGLRRYVRESGFIWSAILEPVYPRQTYWWLYGRPSKEN